MLRVTGFGQTGPYKDRPGFGTLAEAMSGYAHVNGWPDGPPTLPPFALGDGVAALSGAFAVMYALWWREHGRDGRGQVIDLSIVESLFSLLGPQATVYDQLGIVQTRTGNATTWTAPRNTYLSSDGRWLALSASTQAIAERVMKIVGREDLIEQPWFRNHTGRVANAAELDEVIQSWIGARTAEEVVDAFAEFEGAIALVYSIADIVTDPHFVAREAIVERRPRDARARAGAERQPEARPDTGSDRLPRPADRRAQPRRARGRAGTDAGGAAASWRSSASLDSGAAVEESRSV